MSCEKLKNIVYGKNRNNCFLELKGLKYMDGKKIFEFIGNFICDKNDDWGKLIDFFNGNFLVLELVVRYIFDIFFLCNIFEFL